MKTAAGRPRFLHLTTYNRVIYDRAIRAVPPGQRNYDALLWAAVEERYDWSDYVVRGLAPLGYDTRLVVVDFSELQECWAREHDVPWEGDRPWRDVLIRQMAECQPDIVLIENLYRVDRELRHALRGVLPRHARVLGWCFAPIRDFSALDDLDLVLTGAEEYAALFRQNGCSSFVMPLCFPHEILQRVPAGLERSLPFTFCGSLVPDKGWHSERYGTVLELMARAGLDVYASGQEWNAGSWPAKLLKQPWIAQMLAAVRRDVPLAARFPGQVHPPVQGLEYFALLARSRVTFNAHIDIALNFAGNMRLFEATGMGACLLTDARPNLRTLFEPDEEIVTYSNREEAVEKARYLRDHPAECVRIGERGQRRTLRDHTFTNRMRLLDELIRTLL